MDLLFEEKVSSLIKSGIVILILIYSIESVIQKQFLIAFRMSEDKSTMTLNNNFNTDDGGIPYKEVITWFKHFDGTVKTYIRFAIDCDRFFKVIQKKSYKSLIFYVISQLDNSQFPIVIGKEYNTLEELKRSLDEHFGIRVSERILLKQLMSLTKQPNESLFTFYNKLLSKCLEYERFLR